MIFKIYVTCENMKERLETKVLENILNVEEISTVNLNSWALESISDEEVKVEKT